MEGQKSWETQGNRCMSQKNKVNGCLKKENTWSGVCVVPHTCQSCLVCKGFASCWFHASLRIKFDLLREQMVCQWQRKMAVMSGGEYTREHSVQETEAMTYQSETPSNETLT